MSRGLLSVEGLRAGYGDAVVLDDISLDVPEHGSLAVLGRNGVGKSTLLLSIMGYTQVSRGRVLWRGTDVTRMQPHRRARAGLGWVAQEREIFSSLTVEENLTVAARAGQAAGTLSGGEQQMLAIGRTLMTNPRLLLLDEPLEGLAPIIVDELLEALRTVVRSERLSAIVVEQKARKILGFTERAIILERGRVVFAGDSAELANSPDKLAAHLGVSEQGAGSSRQMQ